MASTAETKKKRKKRRKAGVGSDQLSKKANENPIVETQKTIKEQKEESYDYAIVQHDIWTRDPKQQLQAVYWRRKALLHLDKFLQLGEYYQDHLLRFLLSNHRIDWRHIAIFADNLSDSTHIQNLHLDLDISGNHVTSRGVQYLLDAPVLTLECLRLNNIGLTSIHEISLQQHLKILTLDANPVELHSLVTTLPAVPNLEHLSLSRCGLDDTAIGKIVSTILMENKNIMSLNLAHNFITDNSFTPESSSPSKLGYLLQTTPRLQLLHLAGNRKLTEYSARQALFHSLQRPPEQCAPMKHVIMSNCDEDIDPGLLYMLFNIQAVSDPAAVARCPHGCGGVFTSPLCLAIHQAKCDLRPVHCNLGACQTRVPARDYAAHQDTCGFVGELCPNLCQMYVLRRDQREHADLRCPRRPLRCEDCGGQFPAHTERAHREEECPCRLVPCVYPDCGRVLQARHVDGHERDVHRSLYLQFTPQPRRTVVGESALVPSQVEGLQGTLRQLTRLHRHMDETRAERNRRVTMENREAEELRKREEEERLTRREQARAEERTLDLAALAVWLGTVPRICEHGCGARVLDAKYDGHTSQCDNRPYKCELCGEIMMFKLLKRHRLSECVERMVVCNRGNCSSVNVKAKDLDRHNRQNHAMVLNAADSFTSTSGNDSAE